MSGLSLNTDDLGTRGTAIMALAQLMPDPRFSTSLDCGDGTVNATLQSLGGLIDQNALGAATEMYQLGQSLRDAGAAIQAADRARAVS